MSSTALIFLGIAALAPLPLSMRRVPYWIAPTVAILAVGTAAITAAASGTVTGFGLGAAAVLSITAAAFGGLPLAPAAFRIAKRQADAGETTTDTEPLHGGRIIGILERAAVAGAIVAGWPEGMAIVLAVKGLARYPELRGSHASEQFIIGTFASVLWAIAVGGIGRGLFD